MSLLFNRLCRLSFGKINRDQPLGEQPFTVIENLFIQFDVERTSERFPNKVSIQVNNLNATSRAVLEEQDVFVQLEAGYIGVNRQGKPGRIFLGQVSPKGNKSSSVKVGREWITKIEASDGAGLTTATINETFGPGATGQQVIESLAKQLDVGLGAIKGIKDKVFQNGINLTGMVSERLEEVLDQMSLEWSVQEENLQILPPEEPSTVLGILLTPDTGLIGSPVKREEGENGEFFIEFKSLLRPEIKPGVALQIQSRDINGFFKVRKALYRGDNKIGPFEVSCEAEEIPTPAPQFINTPLNIVPGGVVA